MSNLKDQQQSLQDAINTVNSVVVGNQDAIQLAFTTLLAAGHLLIEDLPGVGKTTLARTISQISGLQFRRVQFTSDMLPADIVGVSIYDRDDHTFKFHAGPIFSQVVLADEINRAMPKTQSALLEAMAEEQVSVDGTTHALPSPFFVIATQNPTDLSGTFPLPDSQLDRFLMRISLGYPDRQAERRLLLEGERHSTVSDLPAQLNSETLRALRAAVKKIHISDALVDYAQALVIASRQHASAAVGLSPRAGLALLQAARAYTMLAQRDHVLPEDVQKVFPAVATHRITPIPGTHTAAEIIEQLLDRVAVD